MNDKIDFEVLEVNALYMLQQATALLLSDIERRFKIRGAVFNREKKQLFNRFLNHVKHACVIDDQLLSDDINRAAYNEAKKDNGTWVKNIDDWRKEANELVRLLLLYCDKTATSEENSKQIFELLQRMEGEGIVTDKLLSNFYMK